MDPTRPDLARPAPGRTQKIISAIMAFLLMACIMPFTTPATDVDQEHKQSTVPVMLHYKDEPGETND